MKPDIVLEIVNENVRKKLQQDATNLPDSTVLSDLFDSMDLVELLVEVEAELHLSFNERDITKFETLGDLRHVTRAKFDTDKGRRTSQNVLTPLGRINRAT